MAVQGNSDENISIGSKSCGPQLKVEDGTKRICSNVDPGPVDPSQNIPFRFSGALTLENIRQVQANFITERNWDQFHAPRNVLLAMVGEVGELAEIFQWKGEVKEGLPGWSDEERHHLGQELSDVLLYLVDLASRCNVDLPTAALDKIEHNAKKYKKDTVYGSSKKYDQYE